MEYLRGDEGKIKMSLEIGGRADKFGNEYESLWVASLALCVLSGDAYWIQWEPPGDLSEGVELRLGLSGDVVAVHQCRRENGSVGKWTVASLGKVLRAAQAQLDRPDVDRFVFVSRDRAPELADLAERSRHCDNDPSAFLEMTQSSRQLTQRFRELCMLWELDPGTLGDVERAIHYLQCSTFRVWDISERDSTERLASRLVKGRGHDVVVSIEGLLLRKIGDKVYLEQLRTHLREAGYPPLDLVPGEICPAIEKLRREFDEAVRVALIEDRIIPRSETEQIRRLLADPAGPQVIFLHGTSGSGKSGVLLELTRALATEEMPYLPLRLDIRRPEGTLDRFCADLDLPASPGDCLAAVAAGRPALLIVDQLDAIRWTGAHAGTAWTICKEIFERALSYPMLRVLAACRTFDLDEDPLIRQWERHASESGSVHIERIEAREFTDEVVSTVVGAHGGDYASMSTRERHLLANPQCLYMWCALPRDGGEHPPVQNQTELIAQYWGFLRERVIHEMHVSASDFDAMVRTLVSHLDRNGRLDAPASEVALYQRAVDSLKSLGVLQQVNNRIRFTHQSYLDYLIADHVRQEAIQTGRAPVDWVRDREQSLLRRHQIRQLLQLLRDREPDTYAQTLRALLEGRDIRFHLKHLVLNHLRAVFQPSNQEVEIVLEYVTRDEWRAHVVGETVTGNAAWFELLDEKGILQLWFDSPEETIRNQAGWLCRVFAKEHPVRVERLLMKLWEKGDGASRQLADWSLPLRMEEQTECMFRLRLDRVKSGSYDRDRLEYEVELLAKRNPLRAMRLLEAYIERLVVSWEADSSRQAKLRGIDIEREHLDALEASCRDHAGEAWRRLAPLLDRALALAESDDLRDDNWDPSDRRREIDGVLRLLERLLSGSGRSLASSDPRGTIDRIQAMGVPASKVTRRIIARTLAGGDPVDFADYALDWLREDLNWRRELRGTHERAVDDPARVLIARFAASCTDDCFNRLEIAILAYHIDWERESVRFQGEYLRSRNLLLPNDYGRPQSVLLSAMPRERMSANAARRQEEWLRKFGPIEEYPTSVCGPARFVGSPIEGRTGLLSDKQWLRIITREPTERGVTRRDLGSDRFVESSPSTMSHSLESAARKEPRRFARLALRIPHSAPQAYFTALIRGLSQTNAPPEGMDSRESIEIEDAERIFAHVRPVLEEDMAKVICWLIQGRPHEIWSLLTRGLVFDLARAMQEPSPITEGSGSGPLRVALETTALNSVQGAAAHAITALCYGDENLVAEFLPAIRTMATHPNPAVRLAAMETLGPIYNYNRDLAIDLFLAIADHPSDEVLAGHATQSILGFLRRPYAEQVRPTLERMVGSHIEKVARHGASWVTLQKLTLGRDVDLADASARGTVHQRSGVVEVLVALCEMGEFATAAHQELVGFFDDPDDDVVSEAGNVFRSPEVLSNTRIGPSLARAFSHSSGLLRCASALIDALEGWEGSLQPYGEAIVTTAGRISGELVGNTKNLSHPDGMIGKDMATILLRLYEEADSGGMSQLRRTCLDAWDAMLKGRVGFVREQLEKIDGT